MNYVQDAEQVLRAEVTRTGHNIDDVQARLYTLLLLTKGTGVTLSDVHDAWAVGRNQDRPEHPDLVPFGELSPATVEYDVPFRDAIRAAAARVETRQRPGFYWGAAIRPADLP